MAITRTELVIDISRYEAALNMAELGAVPSVIVKQSQDLLRDPAFMRHAQAVLDGGKILQSYHWLDPLGDLKQEIQVAISVAKSMQVSYVWVDCEQWWSNWGTWYDALTKKIAWSAVARLTPDTLSDSPYRFLSELNSAGIAAGIYTSWGYVTSYAPAISRWIGQFDLWVAHYGQRLPGGPMSWEQLKANWLPKYIPLVPPGTDPARVVGHQFTGDTVRLPGVYIDAAKTTRARLDVSMFDEEFLKSLRGVSTETVVSDAEKLARLWAAHPELH